VQSTGVGVPQEGSLELVLQSTGPGVVLHDGSFGLVLQSISPGGGGVSGPVELEHSGAVDPCSHAPDGGTTVGVGSSIGCGGGLQRN
jgi:hypothetical protein